jgi:predicted lipid-binding transport protein (Tim44 family)
MNGLGFLDILLIAAVSTAAVVASWRLFHETQPPPAGAGSKHPPITSAIGMLEGFRPEQTFPDQPQTPLAQTLKRICIASRYRSIETFLEGAKLAYETITKGFADGSIEPLSFLLSPDVYEDFTQAIASRNRLGETVEQTFIGFRAADIVDAELANGRAWIEVRFVADVISVVRDRDGRNVAGHPAMVVSIGELWTFERELRASEPTWVLTATEPDE